MNESEYRNAVFLRDAAVYVAQRLRREHASAEEVRDADEVLANAQARVDRLILTATPDERRQVFCSLVEGREACY